MPADISNLAKVRRLEGSLDHAWHMTRAPCLFIAVTRMSKCASIGFYSSKLGAWVQM